MLSRLSLRTRLILGVIVLAGAGVVAADVATYTQLRSFLVQRIDNTLTASHPGVENAAFRSDEGHPEPGTDRDIGGQLGSLGGDCVEVRTLSGMVVKHACIPQFGETKKPPIPAYPQTVSLPSKPSTSEGDRVTFLDVPSHNGDTTYRVRASIEGDQPGFVLFIAAPLSSVDSTLHRVLLVELLATIAVLAGFRRDAEAESEHLNQQRADAAAAGERRRSTSADLRRLENELEEVTSRIARHHLELSEASMRIDNLNNSIAEIDRLATTIDEEKAREDLEIASATSRLEAERAEADLLANELAELNRSAAASRDARAAIEVQGAEASARVRQSGGVSWGPSRISSRLRWTRIAGPVPLTTTTPFLMTV